MNAEERFHTVVVGGGQAGLAAGYYLKASGNNFVILESGARVGDAWRQRWDSLKLFTPAKFNGLPGEKFPGEDFSFPSKDDVAGYLEAYARKNSLPIRFGTRVDSLTPSDRSYQLTAGPRRFIAKNVIVATGGYQRPFVPGFAGTLRAGIVQMHSSEYRHPGQIPDDGVLVVGAGNSGGEIALELARAGRKVWLSGRDVGRIPANVLGRLFGGGPYWFLLSHVLSVSTPIGRNVRKKALHQGTPWIRMKPEELRNAGVTRVARVSGVNDGLPCLEDGQVLDVSGIVWATGFKPDYSWIKLPVFNGGGFPEHERGIVEKSAGLYFVGLHFQSALSSAFLGGVGADARGIVRNIRSKKAASSRSLTARMPE